jgi:hypothetical protein
VYKVQYRSTCYQPQGACLRFFAVRADLIVFGMAHVQARETRIRVLQLTNSLPRCAPHTLPPPPPGSTQDTSCAGSVQVTATTELADLLEDPGYRRPRKQVRQPMKPSQGGSDGSTAEE